jgi:hypothetical protein
VVPAQSHVPVDLTLTQRDERLTARLRLSGIDTQGTGTIHGDRFAIAFASMQFPMTGRVVSRQELRVRLGSGGDEIRLMRTERPN